MRKGQTPKALSQYFREKRMEVGAVEEARAEEVRLRGSWCGWREFTGKGKQLQ